MIHTAYIFTSSRTRACRAFFNHSSFRLVSRTLSLTPTHIPKRSMATKTKTFRTNGVRVAVEGCGHGTLDGIYASVATASKARGWDGVDLLIIGGDFQAVRNAADLSVMSVPDKYKKLGDFAAYYSGEKTAPYPTIFIGGNHEASSYLLELYYGGWVAPNIYYLGAANVLRFGPLRIAGMSGIWTESDYFKPHHERLPFSHRDIKSAYHVREIDVRKLLLLREQVDVGLSHDWPRAVEYHGDADALWKIKPFFRKESADGTLGNPAAKYVMDRLRPAYWFSAHMHCKFTAIKKYKPPRSSSAGPVETEITPKEATAPASEPDIATRNPDEIDLDDEDGNEPAGDIHNTGEASPSETQPASSGVPDELRAQLPAAFAPPVQHRSKLTPGQPVPTSITNTTTRFLALDKCGRGRKFIQLCALEPVDPSNLKRYRSSSPSSKASPSKTSRSKTPPPKTSGHRYSLHYDPEWLAITRVFSQHLTIGDPDAAPPPDLGEEAYTQLIDAERAWVDEHIVRAGKLAVPENFEMTAPPHEAGHPEVVSYQPEEYTNPQTAAFCELVGVENLWDASPEERAERRRNAPQLNTGDSGRGKFRGRGGRGGGGRGRGRGGGGRGGRR